MKNSKIGHRSCVQLFMTRAKEKSHTKKLEGERIKECPVIVDGRPCGLQTVRIGTLDTIPSFDEYKCAKGHRTYHPSENEKLKSAENIEKRMDELAHKYTETHEKEIIEELYKLAHQLEKLGEGSLD
jgi:hypothetical protein